MSIDDDGAKSIAARLRRGGPMFSDEETRAMRARLGQTIEAAEAGMELDSIRWLVKRGDTVSANEWDAEWGPLSVPVFNTLRGKGYVEAGAHGVQLTDAGRRTLQP